MEHAQQMDGRRGDALTSRPLWELWRWQHLRALCAFRPIFREPLEGSIEAPCGDVGTFTQGCQFLRIAEDTMRNSRILLNLSCDLVGIG